MTEASSKLLRTICNCLVALSTCAAPLRGDRLAQIEKRRVTVADAIEMRRAESDHFGDELGSRSDPFSPDGKRFIVVTYKGNVERNTVEYTLLLFQTKDALDRPKPQPLLTMSSSSNRAAITRLKWLDDGETLVFLGENPGEVSEVWSFNIQTRALRRLTEHPAPIVSYDVSSDGREIVYEAEARRRLTDDDEIKRDGVVITTQSASSLLACPCDPDQRFDRADLELFVKKTGRPASRIKSMDFLSEYATLSLSPSGRYALLSVDVRDIPESWTKYQGKVLHSYLAGRRRTDVQLNVHRYMLLELSSLTLLPLLGTPMSHLSDAFVWAPDGNSVIVSGAYLPLDVADPAERDARARHTWVVEVTLPARKFAKISDRSLAVLKWNRQTGHVLLGPEEQSAGQSLPAEAYAKTGIGWGKVPVSDEDTRRSTPLEITLEEDLNGPPKVFASDPKEGRKTLLLDLNPQFARLQFGKVEAVTWKASDGHDVSGGLYLPPDYQPERRYPLVIQTHGFAKDRFWIDGPFPSAFAAQPLAARGIIVLQVGGSTDLSEDMKYALTPREAPRQMAAYEGAIDYLDGRGLIDRNRVGILGFSRTVFYVEYSLTHSRYRFAAASVADGVDGGYVNYLLFPDPDYALVNGGLPAGPTMEFWRQNSPGFNLEKVSAPVHIEYYGHESLLAGWQWFSGLSLLGKAVDFVWLPDGFHMLVKPWERLVSQQGTVDWFTFWLLGEKDLSPRKAEQYKRWKQLRALQNGSTQLRDVLH